VAQVHNSSNQQSPSENLLFVNTQTGVETEYVEARLGTEVELVLWGSDELEVQDMFLVVANESGFIKAQDRSLLNEKLQESVRCCDLENLNSTNTTRGVEVSWGLFLDPVLLSPGSAEISVSIQSLLNFSRNFTVSPLLCTTKDREIEAGTYLQVQCPDGSIYMRYCSEHGWDDSDGGFCPEIVLWVSDPDSPQLSDSPKTARLSQLAVAVPLVLAVGCVILIWYEKLCKRKRLRRHPSRNFLYSQDVYQEGIRKKNADLNDPDRGSLRSTSEGKMTAVQKVLPQLFE